MDKQAAIGSITDSINAFADLDSPQWVPYKQPKKQKPIKTEPDMLSNLSEEESEEDRKLVRKVICIATLITCGAVLILIIFNIVVFLTLLRLL